MTFTLLPAVDVVDGQATALTKAKLEPKSPTVPHWSLLSNGRNKARSGCTLSTLMPLLTVAPTMS